MSTNRVGEVAEGNAAQRRAQRALDASPIYEIRHLKIEQSDDGLTLRGQVSSFYHKQVAQELIRYVAGDAAVTNSIMVEA